MNNILILNINEIIDKLNLINNNQINNYNDIVNFIYSCVSSNSSLIINKCLEICKLNKNYINDNWFNKIVDSYNNNCDYSIDFALSIANSSNTQEFKLISEKYLEYNLNENKLLLNIININNHNSIAEYIFFKYKDIIIVNKEQLFFYKDGYWNNIDNIKFFFEKELTDIFNKILNNCKKKGVELNKLQLKELNKLSKKIINVHNKLKTNGLKDSIIKKIFINFTNDNINFDKHLNLLNFNNGTLNLNTRIFSVHNPFDYITKIIPYNYNPNLYSQDDKDELINKISFLFNSNEELKYILWRISLCFYGYNKFKESLFLSCNINTTKILLYLIESVFGSYFNLLNNSYLNKYEKHKRDNIPNNELLKLIGCRIIIINKNNNNIALNTIKLKTLIYNDFISARNLYSNSSKSIIFKPQFTPFILHNSIPTFTNLDEDIISKMLIINLPSNSEIINNFSINIELFLHILLDLYFGKIINKPNSIIEYHNKILLEINTVLSFCISNLEDTKYDKIGISDLYNIFKNSKFNINNITQRSFTDNIKRIYTNIFSNKRFKLNNNVQYILNNKKLNVISSISNISLLDLYDNSPNNIRYGRIGILPYYIENNVKNYILNILNDGTYTDFGGIVSKKVCSYFEDLKNYLNNEYPFVSKYLLNKIETNNILKSLIILLRQIKNDNLNHILILVEVDINILELLKNNINNKTMCIINSFDLYNLFNFNHNYTLNQGLIPLKLAHINKIISI